MMRLFSFLIGLLASSRVVMAAVPVDAIAFSPKGDTIVFNRHRAIGLCDIKSWEGSDLKLDLVKITSVEFSADGKWLGVTGGSPGSKGGFVLIDWERREVALRRAGFADTATAIAFHPRGDQLAVAGSDRSVVVYSIRKGGVVERPSHTLTDHSRPVLDLAYSPDGKLLVTASADRSLKVWNADSGELVRSLGNHTEIVHSVVMRPPVEFAGRLLPAYCASGGDDHTVRIWQPGIGRMVRIVRYHDAPVFALAWHPKGDRLYSAGKEGVIRIIDGDSDEILSKWKAHDDWIYSMAVAPDGKLIATGDWAGVVKVWAIGGESASLIRTLKH